MVMTEKEYFETLDRMIKGAEWIEAERAKEKPDERLPMAIQEYDRLERKILAYKGFLNGPLLQQNQ